MSELSPSGNALVDGGDRACGELLVVLAERARGLPPDSPLGLIATDPAAVVDLPAWCHLTGHHYLGVGRHADGRPRYDLRTGASPRETDPVRPWRLTTSPVPPTPTREEAHS